MSEEKEAPYWQEPSSAPIAVSSPRKMVRLWEPGLYARDPDAEEKSLGTVLLVGQT